MAKTKIGFHCLSGPTGIGQLIADGAALVMSVDDMGVLEEAERLRPGIPKIARFYIPNITAEQGYHSIPRRDPGDFAIWYVNQFANKINLNPILKSPSCWLQGTNEPAFTTNVGGVDVDDPLALRWLVQFEIARIRLLAAMGVKAACLNFSVGYPAIATLRDILPPLLPVMRDHGSILCIHGYSTVPMARDDFRTFRHEKIYNEVLLPLGFASTPMAYTEWGRIGWKNIVDEDTYVNEFREADTRLRSFPGNLLGVAAYTLGGNQDWERYRLDGGMPAKLGEYFRQLASIPDTPPAPPPPTPLPPPAKLFAIGDTVKVSRATALNVRHPPVGNIIGVPLGTQPGGAVGRITSEPFTAWLGGLQIGWVGVNFDTGVDGNVSQAYLDQIVVAPPLPPPPEPLPIPTGVNLLVNPDMFTGGIHTLPGRNNVRLGNGWWLRMIEGWEPRLDRMSTDPNSVWLAIESQYRSRGNVPNTEPLPFDEWQLYLVDGGESETMWHGFKRHGIQWWEMGQDLDLPAGEYLWSISLYPDIYFGSHDFVTNETIAGEWRLNVNVEPMVAWDDGGTPPLGRDERIYFGHWRRLSRQFAHLGGPVSVSLEFLARWGVQTVGAIVKLADLRRIV